MYSVRSLVDLALREKSRKGTPMTFSVLAIDPTYEDLTSAASDYRSKNVYAPLNTNNLRLVPFISSQADADPVSAAALKDGVVISLESDTENTTLFTVTLITQYSLIADLNPSIVAGKIVIFFRVRLEMDSDPRLVALGLSGILWVQRAVYI